MFKRLHETIYNCKNLFQTQIFVSIRYWCTVVHCYWPRGRIKYDQLAMQGLEQIFFFGVKLHTYLYVAKNSDYIEYDSISEIFERLDNSWILNLHRFLVFKISISHEFLKNLDRFQNLKSLIVIIFSPDMLFCASYLKIKKSINLYLISYIFNTFQGFKTKIYQ